MGKVTHDRIAVSKKHWRCNVAFFLKGTLTPHVKLQAALEFTSYGTGVTFYVCDSEGLYFTGMVPYERWGNEMYDAIKVQVQRVFSLDEQGKVVACSGTFVIPEQKLSTGKTDPDKVE
jgi:hypothetical protein